MTGNPSSESRSKAARTRPIGALASILAAHPLIRAALLPLRPLRGYIHRRRESVVQSVTDNLRACLAEDPVLYLQEFKGTFATDSRSHLFSRIASHGAYEPLLAAVCEAHLDVHRDAIDVGANIGFYTTLMAKLVVDRRVLAIEPTPNAARRLHNNLRRNDVDGRVIVFEGAASDTSGMLSITTIEGKEEYSSIGSLVHPSTSGEAAHAIQVAASTIDELVEKHRLAPGFMKIDVEGFERNVLQGAHHTIARFKPIILSELSDALLRQNGTSARHVIDTMREMGYRVVEPLYPSVPCQPKPFGDMLCLPI